MRYINLRLLTYLLTYWRYRQTSFFRPVAPYFQFLTPSTDTQFQGNPFSRGVKYTGVGKICDFRLKSPFISETVRDRLMIAFKWNVNGNHGRRIDPCRFRWPWMTPNPGFKVTVYLQVEYLKNGASRINTLIGNPIPNITNSTMFGDLDWPLNASRGFAGLSASAELLW